MKKIEYLQIVIIGFTLLALIFSLATILFGNVLISIIPIIITISLIIASSSFFLKIVKNQIDNPTTLSISLVGYPSSGKTVYLTTLYNLLGTSRMSNFIFRPYGGETIDRVTKDLNLLSQGIWLPTTPKYPVFYYRARVKKSAGILNLYYKIEVGDFAGSYFEKADMENKELLHTNDYFKYVLQSDIIFLAIDSERLLNSDISRKQIIEHGFIAAMQLLIEDRVDDISKKLEIPVALLFMKSDIINQEEIITLKSSLQKLINYCNYRCKNFEIFRVSSIGKIGPNKTPPKIFSPIGVADPIIWALDQIG